MGQGLVSWHFAYLLTGSQWQWRNRLGRRGPTMVRSLGVSQHLSHKSSVTGGSDVLTTFQCAYYRGLTGRLIGD